MATVNPIPHDCEVAIPYLVCKDAANMLEFYEKAFGAKVAFQMPMPGGKVGHAEILIGKAKVMLADEFPEWNCYSPLTVGGTGSSTMVYVEDVDSFVARAKSAGAKVLMEPETQFYGDRTAKVEDPSGHWWMFSSRVEVVTEEEMLKRGEKLFGSGDRKDSA